MPAWIQIPTCVTIQFRKSCIGGSNEKFLNSGLCFAFPDSQLWGGGENLNLNGFTPDDVDCVNDPDFNHVEILPSGTHPEEFITEEGTFLRCEDEDVRYNADGTISGKWTGSTTGEIYTLLRIAEEACGLSTETLPDYVGDWVVTDVTTGDLEYYDFCFRFDLIPGTIFCYQLSGEDQETVRQIQYGEVVNTFVVATGECTLQEE